MTFDLADSLERLVSTEPEDFHFGRAIRLFQFRTWIYFPADDTDLVRTAGLLSAAACLRSLERKMTPTIGMGDRLDVSATELRKFLKDPEYRQLYNCFFSTDGWIQLANAMTVEEFNKKVVERRQQIDTVCEMIDYRFRRADNETLRPEEYNISRGEFYRWHKHPAGRLSWKTIRQRWSQNKLSACFLYVSERFGFDLAPPVLDLKRHPRALVKEAPNEQKLKDFLATSLYVAEKIGDEVLEELESFPRRFLPRIQPETKPVDPQVLKKMSRYKELHDEMRTGVGNLDLPK